MNTAKLKSFAPAVRRQLIEAVTRKLDFALTAQTPDYLTTFAPQVAALRKLEQADRTGLIERVAYTWFNRLAALRFMDARGWHPFRARVLTAATGGETQPELLRITRAGALPPDLAPHTDPDRLNDLLDGRIPSADPQGEVYRHLVLAACHFYHALLPNLFARLDDETELLLPDDLLTEQSVVEGFRTEISDEDCAEVELLGWLYQFYISERKDTVMARKSAVPTEDIPAVTQLFTPHWIVRYLVENSLGRLWLLNRPDSRLRDHMPYYIEGEAETDSSSEASAKGDFLKITKPEEIRMCDPAVGSGHMLTYAFDLLTLIYEEEGYAPTEIPALILRHNLHGLEICPRAAQLAELALVFKAREKSRRFFQPEHLVRPRIIELRDVRFEEGELDDYFKAIGLASDSQLSTLKPQLTKLLHQFEEAKNFGSLIQPCLDERAIANARRAIEAKDLADPVLHDNTHKKVQRVLEQAESLTQRYHVVVANPPYLGGRQMNGTLKVFAEDKFPESKADLFSMFIERGFQLVVPSGGSAMVTMESWMFLSSFEKLRAKLLASTTIQSMVHMPYLGRGGTSMGINFGTVATIWVNLRGIRICGHFQCIRHYECDEFGVPAEFPTINERSARLASSAFLEMPGQPIAYWVTDKVRKILATYPPLSEAAKPRQGLATSDNQRFLRRWHEVGLSNTGFSHPSRESAKQSRLRWFPCQKGGSVRKWYGNHEYLVNWYDDGKEMIALAAELYGSPTRTVKNMPFYFREGITWSTLSSASFSMRYSPLGFISETKGAVCFADDHATLLALLGFSNTHLVSYLLSATCPTLDFHEGPIGRLPFVPPADRSAVLETVGLAVALARADWDNFETSWDFRDQPLLRPGLKGATLEASWRNWEAQSAAAIRRMQELETENNRLFIAAYGLDGELEPEVPEDQITLTRSEARRDMAAFLSYAVGCMMGRYSPDAAGLVLVNAGDTLEDYLARIEKPLEALQFAPDEDGIIPVLDGEWFADDIAARTRDFLRATFGEATLRENLRFIEDSLGKDLRKYFLTDFYKDHLQTYKKRPIYWMIQSPKKGFQCLIYLHRYTRDTMNLVLNRYLRDYQAKLRDRLTQLVDIQANADSAKEKTEARKEAEKLTKTLHECDEWERDTLLPLAQARVDLDLDDGVKVNYLKLQEALAPIPGLATKES